MKRPHLSAIIETLQFHGHTIRWYHSCSKIIIERYDEFTFSPRDAEDQRLAKEMINLDYDILVLSAK